MGGAGGERSNLLSVLRLAEDGASPCRSWHAAARRNRLLWSRKHAVMMPGCVCVSVWVLSAPWGRCRVPPLQMALAQPLPAFDEGSQPWLLQSMSLRER